MVTQLSTTLREPVREQNTVAILLPNPNSSLPRVISVREAARLRHFRLVRFHQTKWHGFRQVGNAVSTTAVRPWDAKCRHFISYSITAEPVELETLSCWVLMGRLSAGKQNKTR